MTCWRNYSSPIGELLLAGEGETIHRIHFANSSAQDLIRQSLPEDADGFTQACRELDAFFAGQLQSFTFPMAPQGSPFQMAVWRLLLEIPYGETETYGVLAKRLNKPDASRAVGLANGSNPIPIAIPCHRVIGANGKLTGFGGGLPVKQWLLDWERAHSGLFSGLPSGTNLAIAGPSNARKST